MCAGIQWGADDCCVTLVIFGASVLGCSSVASCYILSWVLTAQARSSMDIIMRLEMKLLG